MYTRHSRQRTRPVALSGLMALLLVLFTLVPSAVPAAAASSLRLNRANVAAGDTLTVSGFGFHAGDTAVVSLDYAYGASNRRLQTAVTVAANGVFSATLTIPNSITPNDYTVSARDFHGATASTSLRVLPLILLQAGQKSSGAVTVTAGQAFYVRGHGFGAGHQVTLKVTFPRYGASTVTLAHTVTSASDGSFGDVYFQTPVDSTVGTAALSATSSAGKTARAYVRIAYHPHISLSASTIIPGASFTVNGSGFVPNSRVTVSVSLPRNGAATETIAQQVTANGSGSFSTTLATPSNVRTGTSTVTALDSTAGLTTSTSLRVSVHPTIALSQSEAVPGKIITVTGGGFTVSADVILTAHFALYGGGSKTVTVVTRSGSAGNITTQLQVPQRAAPGTVSVLAKGPNGQASTALHVRAIASSIVVTSSVIPGSALSIRGTGFEPNRTIDIHTTIKLLSGTTKLLSKSVTTNSSGTFTTTLGIPSNVLGGSYSISATTAATGRTRTARFTIAALRPSIVLVPTMVIPGAAVTVNGFGFGAGESVTLSLTSGQKLSTVTTNGSGRFSISVTVPANLATGGYTLSAASAAGRTARIALNVERTISTHFYFASEYTGRGYREYLAFLNPTDIQARVTISYQRTAGAPVTKTITIGAHSRATENVNSDLGTHVSAAAAVSADVPIVAERLVYHGVDGSIVPGSHRTSTVWYFANGNTSRTYREYIAVQNPNSGPVQVAIHFLPTHHRAFTAYRTMGAFSRTTFKVNSYVRHDAVGVTVTANGPIIANRTIFILHGMTSKAGVTAPHTTWYFAAGPSNPSAHNWIGAINPTNQRSYMTMHVYDRYGNEVGTVHRFLKPYARVGLLINRIGHGPNAAVVLTTSRPIVAEQTTYAGRMHNQSTDTFGAIAPAKIWSFAAVNTTGGAQDQLDLFNPSLLPEPIVVQFITSSGSVTNRTYIVNPLSHQAVGVGSVEPNQQLGLVAASSEPFVALNRYTFNSGQGSATSIGTR